MISAATIARSLQGHRQGHNWRCPCPLGCGYAVSIADGENGLLIHCFGGCGYEEVLTTLVEHGLLDCDDGDDEGRPAGVVLRHAELDPAKIAAARTVYEAGRSGDERIGRYLRSRAITITPPVLRYHEQVRHRLGGVGPAMLAPVVDVRGEFIGLHMTFLSRVGDGKAEIHRDYQRECRGVIRGGAIRLAHHDPNRGLLLGEGIETTLSAMEIFDLPGWAAGSAGGLKTLELPDEVRNVIIAADHDRAGLQNAFAMRAWWLIEQGRSAQVVVVCPPVSGQDFNNVLQGRRKG